MIELVEISPAENLPWWAWLVIWSILVVALLAVLAVATWMLFRKGLGVMDALGRLADTTAILEAEERALTPPQRAILADLRSIRDRQDARRVRREARRRERWERRLARARRITSVDPTEMELPIGWTNRAARR